MSRFCFCVEVYMGERVSGNRTFDTKSRRRYVHFLNYLLRAMSLSSFLVRVSRDFSQALFLPL